MKTETFKGLRGTATLYLGDCLDILPTLGQIDSLVSDPPYGMSFQSNFRNVQHERIKNDESESLLIWACGIKVMYSSYIFCRWDNLPNVPRPKSCITWVKNNWSMGDLHHEHARQTEIALFYAGSEHFFPSGRPRDVIFADRTCNENHPTEKPISLMAKICEWTSGTVVDPFMGSGTTGIACLRTGRNFIGIELDPKHYQTACERMAREIDGELL